MKNVTIKEAYRNTEELINKEVQIKGWVRTVRSSKEFGFIEINGYSGS